MMDSGKLRENCKGRISVDGTGTYDSNSIFRFYAFNDLKIIDPEREWFRELPDDSTLAWIGIPGDRIGKDADSNKIYMLQWTEDGGIQAKGFKAPEDYRKRPDISDKEERKQAAFLVSFKSSTNYYTLQCSSSEDPLDFSGKFIRTVASGNITTISVKQDNNQFSYDPGMLYYLPYVDDSEF
ncbi:uncharacterized protein [Ptychodera flava]|uniref:uncharacterized protein n=1 Tax=Ptychodera flava TaxID=63121 RepID=UPI00396A5B79